MHESLCQIWWSIVVLVVFVAGSELETIPDCIGCRTEQAELGEYLKTQKIAHRLEYIKQQLMTNLNMKSVPIETPKFDSLPDFLVQKLVYEDTTNKDIDRFAEGTTDEPAIRQMVLFVEEENTTCGSSTKRGLCLNFKLSDDVLSSGRLSSAILWFYKKNLPILTSGPQNFTITDKTLLNPRNRMGRNITSNYVTEKDGWYQIDVTPHVKSWLAHKSYKHRVLMISCDSCIGTEYATNTTSQNFNKTSFLFLNTENEENARLKRGVDCTPGREECCREDLWVEFSALGDEYRMVVGPVKFNAYVCRGSCYLASSSDIHKPYADLLSAMKRKKEDYTLPTTCCTPTKLAGLPVVFARDKYTLQRATIPNMIVESCGCV